MESDDSGLFKWLSNVDKFGFSFVSGVPASTEATEELVQRIGFIRETQYGKFWDFTSDLAKGDTAYTTMALAAHTDNTYFVSSILYVIQLLGIIASYLSWLNADRPMRTTTLPPPLPHRRNRRLHSPSRRLLRSFPPQRIAPIRLRYPLSSWCTRTCSWRTHFDIHAFNTRCLPGPSTS